MEFSEIVKKRYAVKEFTGKKVPEETIHTLLDIIRYAPSSFNIQPWKIKIVTDQALKEKLSPAAWNQAQITTCSHLLIFCANSDVKGNIDKLGELMVKNGATKEGIKGYMDMMYGAEAKMSPEQQVSWAQRQTYLALSNAVNGAVSLGLDSCPMEGFDPAQIAQLLDLPKNLIPTALCAVGYAADKPRPKLRFPQEEVFF